MLDEDRGKIRYLNRYKQPISYEGMMRRRKITPTDIDGLIDYHGNCFIYIEGKGVGAPIEYGQRKALENLVDSHVKAGHPACAVIFRHTSDSDSIVIAKDQRVDLIYHNKQWRPPVAPMTVLQFIERWESYHESQNVKL